VNHTEKMCQVLLKPGGDPSVVLQLQEEVFHQVSILVQALIIFSRLSGIPTAGNHRLSALGLYGGHQILSVISLVGKHITVFQIKTCYQFLGRLVVAYLATRQVNPYRIAQCIHYGMDLGGISTSRTTNPLFFVPPFPPEPCWCTRTYDPSIISSSSSRSLDSPSKSFSHSPRLVHRVYRLYALLQGPYRSGKSRQGAPVFSIQMTALIISRLSLAGRPFLPERSRGNRSLIRSHCSSVNSCRFIMSSSMTGCAFLQVSGTLSVYFFLRTLSNMDIETDVYRTSHAGEYVNATNPGEISNSQYIIHC